MSFLHWQDTVSLAGVCPIFGPKYQALPESLNKRLILVSRYMAQKFPPKSCSNVRFKFCRPYRWKYKHLKYVDRLGICFKTLL